jgi:uncharacterized damage-inducible protein DinB
MKRLFSFFSGISLLTLIFICPLFGFNNPDEASAFLQEYAGQVDFVQGRILQLENAMPQEKFEWRPGEGVRSVAEVYLHIAEANMMLVSYMTGEKTESDIDEKITDKEKIAEIVKKSFEAVKEAVPKLTEDDLNKSIKAFGMEMTLRNFMISMLNHSHEHLGQSIAYARMNKVVPPWSMPSEQK